MTKSSPFHSTHLFLGLVAIALFSGWAFWAFFTSNSQETQTDPATPDDSIDRQMALPLS